MHYFVRVRTSQVIHSGSYSAIDVREYSVNALINMRHAP